MKFIVEIPDREFEKLREDFPEEITDEANEDLLRVTIEDRFDYVTAREFEGLTPKDIHDAEALDIWLENTTRPYEAYLVRKMLGIIEPDYEEIYEAFEKGEVTIAKETKLVTGSRDQGTEKKED